MAELRVIYWNAAGLRNRLPFLRHLLRDNAADIALINESHLPSSFAANLPGYHILRLDATADTPRRGLLVAVRRAIVHRPLPATDTQSLQSLGVEVHFGARTIRVYAIYHPGSVRLRTQEIHQLLDNPSPTMAAGDWNARHPAWRCLSACVSGRRLYEDAVRHGYEVVGPEDPTHYSLANLYQPTTIDLVVHRGLDELQLETLPDAFGSDHQPVLATLTGRLTLARAPPPGRRVSWERFEAHLGAQKLATTDPVTSHEDIDRLEANITATISEALEAATLPASPHSLPPIPARVRALIEDKRRTRAEWQRSRDPAQKAKVNRLITEIREALTESAADSWERRIAEADADHPSLNRLCRQLTKRRPPTHPLYHTDGTLRYTAEDRAEILAEHLASVFQPNASDRPEHHARMEAEVADALRSPPLPQPAPPCFSPSAVRKAAAKLKPKKAPGIDGITNGALRHLNMRTIAALARLFNSILRLGYFPQAWREGLVVMLPKAGKSPRRPESYRPITLLSAVAKLFEKLFLPLLLPHIPPRAEQYGFRSGHSTTLQVARVVHHAAHTLNRKESATAAFLDVSHAFDRVWHVGLLRKVLNTDTPYCVVRTLASFLNNRTFRVRVESAWSGSHSIAAGVPQGSILSPALYSLYTDDIPVQQGTLLALYADDIALMTTSLNPTHAAKKLQRALDLLPDWLAEWRLALNVAKTQAVSFGNHKRQPPPLTLHGQQVPWSNRATYLGVAIDRRLNMVAHTKKATQAARAALFLLRPLLRSSLPLRTKLQLYKAYVRPHLTYASPAWYALLSPRQQKNVQVVQNLALRRVTQAPYCVKNSTLHRDLRMESLEEHVGRLAVNTFRRADESAHLHLKNIAPLHARPPDSKHMLKLPRDILPPPNSDS